MGTLKIYFIEYDENGNEIRRGVHPDKEYKTYGHALQTAYKVYGDRDRFEVYVDTREPWGEYYGKGTCSICKRSFDYIEDSRGLAGDTRIGLYDRRECAVFRTHRERRKLGYPRIGVNTQLRVCPECYEKITNYVDSITVKEN